MVFIHISSDVFDFGCGCLLRAVLSLYFFLIFLKSFLVTLGIVVGFESFCHAPIALGFLLACKGENTVFQLFC